MRVLLIENLESDFYSSRANFAYLLIEEGWEVHVLLPDEGYNRPKLNRELTIHNWNLKRKNKSLFNLISLSFELNQLKKRIAFDVVHSFRFQPNLISAISKMNGERKLMHITGLGTVFSNSSLKSLALVQLSRLIYLYKLFRADKLIFQNDEDVVTLFGRLKWFYQRKISVIYGSGVAAQNSIRKLEFSNGNSLKFVCVTRLIKEKGIYELLDAFEIHIRGYPNHELWIIGGEDIDNPNSVKIEDLDIYASRNIRILGRREDVLELLSEADVFIYPSYYREGVPRAIIEALAIGLPIITTDMPGCNLTVNTFNGILIRPRRVDDLVKALHNITKFNLPITSVHSKELFEERFEANKIYRKIFRLYEY
uniref:glycosyltransferase n=1 Tax=Algoriphagus sp. TaxID=1872435 RepID=UPI004048CEFD